MKKLLLMAFVACLLLTPGRDANATLNRDLTYRYTQIWNGLVRFLRVDKGFQVVESNRSAGYIMFEFQENGKTHPASFELIPMVKEGRRYIRVGLRISDMPTYIEVVLFDNLMIKFKKDFGLPPIPKVVETKTGGDGKAGSADGKGPKTGLDNEPPEDEEDMEVDEDKLDESQEEREND